jgi:hypothetical protein
MLNIKDIDVLCLLSYVEYLRLCRMYIFYRYIRCECCSRVAHRFSSVQDVHIGSENCSGSPIKLTTNLCTWNFFQF